MPLDYANLYTRFDAPIAAFDCGVYCAPHNPRGAPFCCDSQHAVPVIYKDEWSYLEANTNLWHRWQGRTPAETQRLLDETPNGMLPVECLGHKLCQRAFRALSCRAFPFFPYITRDDRFIGMSYYWGYEKQCWVISNLAVVSAAYRTEFFAAFDEILFSLPGEWESYWKLSTNMRRVFSRRKRAIPLLHRNGGCYKVTPRSGRIRRVAVESTAKFGPYRQ